MGSGYGRSRELYRHDFMPNLVKGFYFIARATSGDQHANRGSTA